MRLILFVGDSHVRQYIFSLEHILLKTSNVAITLWITSEELISGLWKKIIQSYNLKIYYLFIISFYYFQYFNIIEMFDKEFIHLISYLINFNKTIIVFNDNPSFTQSPINYYINTNRRIINSNMCIRTKKYPLYKGDKHYKIKYMSLDKILFSKNSCKILDNNNIFMYSDTNHLSLPYLQSISNVIYEMVKMYINFSIVSTVGYTNRCPFYALNENTFKIINNCKKKK